VKNRNPKKTQIESTMEKDENRVRDGRGRREGQKGNSRRNMGLFWGRKQIEKRERAGKISESLQSIGPKDQVSALGLHASGTKLIISPNRQRRGTGKGKSRRKKKRDRDGFFKRRGNWASDLHLIQHQGQKKFAVDAASWGCSNRGGKEWVSKGKKHWGESSHSVWSDFSSIS